MSLRCSRGRGLSPTPRAASFIEDDEKHPASLDRSESLRPFGLAVRFFLSTVSRLLCRMRKRDSDSQGESGVGLQKMRRLVGVHWTSVQRLRGDWSIIAL